MMNNLKVFVITGIFCLTTCLFSKTYIVDIKVIPTIKVKVFITNLNSGDTLIIKPGLYSEPQSWGVPAGAVVIGDGGPENTRIIFTSSKDAVVLNSNTVLKGLDITNKMGSENTIRMNQVENVLVQDCIIHDAGGDGDCIKVSSCKNLRIDHCILYNPGKRGSESLQECIDFIDTKWSYVSNCWLFIRAQHSGGDRTCYAKGGSEDMFFENNVFGPLTYGLAVGFGCSTWGQGSGYQYMSFRQTVRNNVFVHCYRAATFFEPKDPYFYNNIVYNVTRGFDNATA
ncbi:MAG: right-handed parallel beta-helix repeat-containing protein, partial [bacterium]